MSTMTPPVPPAATLIEASRPTIARLTLIELRKTVDTRAGRWLLIVIGLLGVGIGVAVVVDGSAQPFRDIYLFELVPTILLLPVLGILSVTSEWSQRTALTTFSLVPGRTRVVVAKLLASVVLALASVVVALTLTAVATGIAAALGDSPADWSLSPQVVAITVLGQVLYVMSGFVFGLLFLQSALAIVTSFVVPTLWSVLAAVIPGVLEPSRWVDLGGALGPLSESAALTGEQWAHLASSSLVWIAVPFAVGLARVRHAEIS